MLGISLLLPAGTPRPLDAQPIAPGTAVLACAGSSDDFLAIRLSDGGSARVDPRRRDPLDLAWQELDQNIFELIGRSTDQAARVGEILLGAIHQGERLDALLYVEPAIGYIAYFEKLGRGKKLGELSTVLGRPFEAIAANDDNFALLMRRTGSGTTAGAYLYHATTGRTLYAEGIAKLESEPTVRQAGALPALTGRVAAAELHAGRRATAGYLLLDSGNGDAHVALVGDTAPTQLTVRPLDLPLFENLGQDGVSSPQRLVAVPILDSDDVTRVVLVADASTGKMVLLLDPLGTPQIAPVAAGLDTLLPNAGGRTLTAVPRHDVDGATIGVWILDSASGRTVYIDQPTSAAELRVIPVTLALD